MPAVVWASPRVCGQVLVWQPCHVIGRRTGSRAQRTRRRLYEIRRRCEIPSVSRRCHNSCETHRLDTCGRVRTTVGLYGPKSQVGQYVPAPSVGIAWTGTDSGKRAVSASGAEGRRFESCRGHSFQRSSEAVFERCRSLRTFSVVANPTISGKRCRSTSQRIAPWLGITTRLTTAGQQKWMGLLPWQGPDSTRDRRLTRGPDHLSDQQARSQRKHQNRCRRGLGQRQAP